MGYFGHRPDDGRFPLLRNYSRVDREVDQERQWIGKGRSRAETMQKQMRANCISFVINKGPSIKYVTLFLANFYPPSPCHTSSHIPGPPESTSHISDPSPDF